VDIGFTLYGEYVHIFTINTIILQAFMCWVLIFVYGVASYNLIYPKLPTAYRDMDITVAPFTDQDADAMMWSDVGQE